MHFGNRKRWIGLMMFLFIILWGLSMPFRCFASVPGHINLFSGQLARIDLALPVAAQVSVKDPDIVRVNGSFRYFSQINLKDPIQLVSGHSGETILKVSLFGKIPLKTVLVHVEPELKVVPGGQTIGVKLQSAGILVVGHHRISVDGNKLVSPGENANLLVGDLIVSVNGVPIREVDKIGTFTEKAGLSGSTLHFIVVRNGNRVNVKLKPAYDINDHSYRLGLYIRDSAAGVGTLTFYAPEQKRYGALGHIITDMDTQLPIVVGGGEIVHSNVTSIAKSQNGDPGEKIAHFFRESRVLGDIEKNTPFGIFGNMTDIPDHGVVAKALPVAFAKEVKEGPAQIYTVVSGQKVEKFNVEITHVSKQAFPATKGLVLQITDKRLLERTGGIVQGMSGSPIIQNGKIVGAVTHVFVNNPTAGYGCFIEWMLRDAGIMGKSQAFEPRAS
ncbi:MAG: SpoIVB peptidase [Gorillibacterium sp.]|nr:SpoIVB peptidase [Gorillibacterium sp.]